MRRRLLSGLLALAMVLTLLPVLAAAAPAAPAAADTRTSDGIAKELGAPTGTTRNQPFINGEPSANYRIPALITLKDNSGTYDGRLLAAIDARWTTAADGGGLDTIISTSDDNGATWHYKMVNFFNDTTNVYNSRGTTFIDPALAQDSTGRVYMLVDAFPGGTTTAGLYQTPAPGVSGYVSVGGKDCMALYASPNRDEQTDENWTHFIGDFGEDGFAGVYAKGDVAMSAPLYFVDRWFYLYETDKTTHLTTDQIGSNKTIDANVFFFNDAVNEEDEIVQLHLRAANFLWMVTSDDMGESWSAPTVFSDQVRGPVNGIGTDGTAEQATSVFLGAGPGRGLATDVIDGEERVYFPVYDHAGGSERTSIAWTEDRGQTWHKGPTMDKQSSEAVLVEANGHIFVFSRQYNDVGYAVLSDDGTQWVRNTNNIPGIYNGCQFCAIAYSETVTVNGEEKVAILVSAPSSGNRINGRVWVGLLDADGQDVDIEWQDPYHVNDGGTGYAYSCITELADGGEGVNNSLGILYEQGNSGIKLFTKLSPAVIFGDDAVVGGIQTHEIPLYGTRTLTFAAAQEEVTAALAQVDQSVIDFTVSSLEEGEVSVTFFGRSEGSAAFTLNGVKYAVTVVPQNVVEVDLRVGESWECSSPHNSPEIEWGSTTDLLNQSVRTENVSLDGSKLYGERYDASKADFSGGYTDLDGALFTAESVSASDSSVSLALKAQIAADQFIYLSTRAHNGGYPFDSSSRTLTVQKSTQGGENAFEIMDTGSGGGGQYLYFHHDGSAHFNRNSVAAADGVTDFLLLTKDTEVTQEAPGKFGELGYKQVTELSQLKTGSQYLVVNECDGKYYVLYPSDSTSDVYAFVRCLYTGQYEIGQVCYLNVKAVKEGTCDVMVDGVIHRFYIGPRETVDLYIREGETLQGVIPHEVGQFDEGGFTGDSASPYLEKVSDKATLGRADDYAYNDSKVPVSQALYTITGENGSYDIRSAYDTSVHLHLRSGVAGLVGSTEAGHWTVASSGRTAPFTLFDSGTYSGYLYFHFDAASNLRFNQQMGEATDGHIDFYLYTRDNSANHFTEADLVGDELPGFYQLTSPDQIVSGAQYLIAAKANAAAGGGTYVVYPSLSADANNIGYASHVARVCAVSEQEEYSSYYLRVTGNKTGVTEVVLEGVLYRIHVAGNELEVTEPDVTVVNEAQDVPQEVITAVGASSVITDDGVVMLSELLTEKIRAQIDETDLLSKAQAAAQNAGFVTAEIANTVHPVAEPYLKLAITDYEETDSGKVLTLDISARVRISATTAFEGQELIYEGENRNAVQMDDKPMVNIVTPIELEVRLPRGFLTDPDAPVYVGHTKAESAEDANWHYHLGTRDNNVITFISSDGLSPFQISGGLTMAARIGEQYYRTLQDAVDAARTGATVTVLDGNTAGAEVSQSTTLVLVDENGDRVTDEELLSAASGSGLNRYFSDGVFTFSAAGGGVVSGGGGGGGAAPSFPVSAGSSDNGSVEVPSGKVQAGQKVTVSPKPATGYVASGVTVTDGSGNSIPVTANGDGTYTFVMPASGVTVTGSFALLTTRFTDVAANDWFREAVDYAVTRGLMDGMSKTTFAPQTKVTRGMLVTLLYRLEGSPTVGEADFTDVAEGKYYADAVAWAAMHDIVKGYADGTFRPEEIITREDMAVILYRYADYRGYEVTARADLSGYTDAGNVSSYAADAMSWANSGGLITGRTETTLAPKGDASRAEAATILMRFCEKYDQ